MKKALYFLRILAIFLACALPLAAEEATVSAASAVPEQGPETSGSSGDGAQADPARRVAVTILPFRNATGVDAYDAASGMAMDILTFSLKSLSECDVSVLESDPVGRTDESLGAWAAACGVDIVLYGEIVLEGEGAVRVRLSAYNRERGKTIMSDETETVPLLEMFSVCDTLSLSVISEMTGTHIGFARINFANSGEQGSYEVLIDGNTVGRDLSSIAGWREGFHEIVVRQDRMLGAHELTRQGVTLVEGVPCSVSFSVPRLLPDEKKRVGELEGEIQTLWDVKGSEATVDRDIAAYSALFSRIEYCPSLAPYRDKAAKLVASREAYMREQRVRLLSERVTALEEENRQISRNLATLTEEIRSRFPQTAQTEKKPQAASASESAKEYPESVPYSPPKESGKNYRAAGVSSLVIGVIGAAVCGFAYMQGKAAYSDYRDATTISAAQDARSDSDKWGTIAMVGGGVGGFGLLAAPICFILDAKQRHAAAKR